MTIANVVFGFRGTVIYPFSPKAKFPVQGEVTNSPSQPSSDCILGTSDSASNPQRDSTMSPGDTLTPKIIELYNRRVENGYNIFTDLNYVAWLESFIPNTFHLLVCC